MPRIVELPPDEPLLPDGSKVAGWWLAVAAPDPCPAQPQGVAAALLRQV